MESNNQRSCIKLKDSILDYLVTSTMFTLGLEHLNLGGNKLAFKENASQLKKFKKLKSLVLSENRITD